MGFGAKVAAIEIVGDEVRLAVVKTGGRLPKVLELHACRAEYGPGADDSSGYSGYEPGEQAPVPTEGGEDAEAQKQFDALVRAVETVVKRVRTRPAAWVLCAPSQNSIARALTIPFRGKRRVSAAVQFELEPYLAFPIEELIIDYVAIKEAGKETEVLTVGMRRAYLVEQLAILEAAGVDVQGIGLDGIGLTALWQGGRRSWKGLHAALHVREQNAVFAIVQGKNLAYFRHISISAAEVRENPAVLVRQIQNSIRAFAAGRREEITLNGLSFTGVELYEDERALLQEQLNVPVFQESLFGRLRGGRRALKAALREAAKMSRESEFSDQPPSCESASAVAGNYWTAAIGVAMGARGGNYALNFRKGDLAWPHALRGVVNHVLFSSCLILLALMGVAWYYHEETNKNLSDIQVLQEQYDGLVAEIEAMQAQGIDVPLDLFSDPPLLDVLAELAAKMPDQKVRITKLKISPAGLQSNEWIAIAGETESKAVFDGVFEDLKQSTLFRIEDEPDYVMQGGKSTFTILLKRPVTEEQDADAVPEEKRHGQAEGNQ
ncbi:MAG: hypothetical protein QG656_2653 [Candidatus Hydrogenedentes bacterium]|nr:hypothetical protein [Candidatus Hydrogenedentota bacterium]